MMIAAPTIVEFPARKQHTILQMEDARPINAGNDAVTDLISEFGDPAVAATPMSDQHEGQRMATSPIQCGNASGPECEEPSSGRLVELSAWRKSSAATKRIQGPWQGPSGRLYHANNQFTPIDQASLTVWAGDIDHGYHRLEVEQGLLEDGSWASYALIYRRGQVWSTWGAMRRGDHIEVWRCASGKTLGCYALMATALLSLPCATHHQRSLRVSAADEGVDQSCDSANSIRV